MSDTSNQQGDILRTHQWQRLPHPCPHAEQRKAENKAAEGLSDQGELKGVLRPAKPMRWLHGRPPASIGQAEQKSTRHLNHADQPCFVIRDRYSKKYLTDYSQQGGGVFGAPIAAIRFPNWHAAAEKRLMMNYDRHPIGGLEVVECVVTTRVTMGKVADA